MYIQQILMFYPKLSKLVICMQIMITVRMLLASYWGYEIYISLLLFYNVVTEIDMGFGKDNIFYFFFSKRYCFEFTMMLKVKLYTKQKENTQICGKNLLPNREAACWFVISATIVSVIGHYGVELYSSEVDFGQGWNRLRKNCLAI